MMKTLSQNIRARFLAITTLIAMSLLSSGALGWTSAKLAEVNTVLQVSKEGPSTMRTEARFEVFGGSFHGFDLSPFSGGDLVREECTARLDDGRRYPLHFRTLYDGRIRVVLADKASVKHGGITFYLVHETDLVATGSLREYTGRARLDWTPIVWDGGTNKMTLKVELPGKSADAPIYLDPDVSRDYEAQVSGQAATLTKYRTVRWYPMQVVMDFDRALVSSLADARPEETAAVAEEEDERVAAAAAVDKGTPFHISVMPAIAALFGLLLMLAKSFSRRRVLQDLQLQHAFRLLPNTGVALRLALSFLCAALGVFAQHRGSLAAGTLPMAVAAALWIGRKVEGSMTPRAGGRWRRMDDADMAAYSRLCAAYRRRRRSWLDISWVGGVATFMLAAAAIGYGILVSKGAWPRTAWAVALNGIIWATPIWFSGVRSELPVDPTIEGFGSLRRWRRSLARIVGAKVPGADASFWVREDDKGTIEVRLRVDNPPVDIKGIEIAGEMVRSGSTVKARKAIILRMEPGTCAARRLAACTYAVEHHLTPDLEEEIIVLRNRRGRTPAGLAPLKAAIGMVRAVARA